MFRYHDGAPHVPGLLGDQAYMARALLDAHEVTGDPAHLERAEALARLVLNRFADRRGDGAPAGFFDVWDAGDSLGRLSERQKSVQDNAVCAEALIRLHHLTRNEEYAEAARGTLEAFAPSYPALGYFAAGYAKQVDLLLEPPAAVNIVGEAEDEGARALHRAALRLDVPFRIVQLLDPVRDAARLEALYPAYGGPAPAAYVCLGTMCSAPVSEPPTLADAVAQMRTAANRTLQ
jgi:uncharacterized protein YyaL (SSP411 family)